MPLKITAQKNGDLEIELYDVIGFWGLTAKDFAAKLKAAKGKNVTLRINSPGGSVNEGTVMYNLLKAHDGEVTAYIDGIAASMAGVIACAADRIVMPDNTFFMIHNPSALIEGDGDDLRKVAKLLDDMRENLINAYVAKTGKKFAVVEKWFEGENYYSAKECAAMGIADEVVDSIEAAACARFANYFPDSKFAAAAASLPPVIPTGGRQEHQPTENEMKSIIALLGLAATATEAEVAAEVQTVKNRVAALEKEKSETVTAHAKAIEDGKKEALQTANTAEAKRRTDIKALTDKYNKDGDLNEVTVTALSGSVTPADFKDQILEVVAKRATKPALRPAGGKAGGTQTEDEPKDEVADFVAKYKDADDAGRRALIRSNRALARRASHGIKALDE